MDYILKITEQGIVIPNGIPEGEYKLVLMTEAVKKKRIKIYLIYQSYYAEKNGRRDWCFGHALRELNNLGFSYLDELEGMSLENINEMSTKSNWKFFGKKTQIALLAICKYFGTNIKCSEKKYGREVEEYVKLIKKC